MSSKALNIHCIAIGGSGMAPLACLLQELGHRVRGSDFALYPPMSTLLEAAGIEPLVGFDEEHLRPLPDLFIVGNAVPRHNVEARAVEALEVPRLSMPEALGRFFLARRRPLVVAGTHGKTTTTSMAAWVYDRCGQEPGYLIGGVPLGMSRSFRLGAGERFVIEGDEYNAAYFDRGPKFWHYRADTLILTSVEHDHVDLYPDAQSLLTAYRKLVRALPPQGCLVACGDSPEVRKVAAEAPCKVVFYGQDQRNDLYPLDGVAAGSRESRLRIADAEVGEVELRLRMPGSHNVSNALAVWAAARHDRLSPRAVAKALADFGGVRRRLEEIGQARGVTVIDDFAHHPTAIGKSLEGLRQRYPGRRLLACFEPRSLTAGRSFLFPAYLEALALAERVFFAPIFHFGRIEEEERLDLDLLCSRLRDLGTDALSCDSTEALMDRTLAECRQGDVLVTMSSGSFEGLPGRLLAALRERSG